MGNNCVKGQEVKRPSVKILSVTETVEFRIKEGPTSFALGLANMLANGNPSDEMIDVSNAAALFVLELGDYKPLHATNRVPARCGEIPVGLIVKEKKFNGDSSTNFYLSGVVADNCYLKELRGCPFTANYDSEKSKNPNVRYAGAVGVTIKTTNLD